MKEVSIIIPTYKRTNDMLKRAIKSVLNQTYKKYEIIVVDDNTKDDEFYMETKACEEYYSKNKQIKFLYNDKNQGANFSRNRGIKESKNDIIAFLDSDDEYHNTYIEKSVSKINSSEKIGLCYSAYNAIYPNFTKVENVNGLNGYIYEKEIIHDRISPTSCVVLKKDCCKSGLYFDESLPARQDFDMWVRITKNYEVISINEPLVNVYWDGHESISSSFNKKIDGTKIVYEKILNDVKDKKLIKKIKSALNENIGNIYIHHKDYKNACKYYKTSLKYTLNIKILLKVILIQLGIYKKIKK